MFEIFFEDLKPKVQEDILSYLGLQTPAEMNWDTIPIAEILPCESDGQINTEDFIAD